MMHKLILVGPGTKIVFCSCYYRDIVLKSQIRSIACDAHVFQQDSAPARQTVKLL